MDGASIILPGLCWLVPITHQRNSRYVGLLALASCLILIGGWLARPRDRSTNPAPVPSETELEQLARRTERRSLDSMAKYFAGVARDVDASVARVNRLGVSGIVWDEWRVVTPPLPRGPGSRAVSVAAATGEVEAQPTVWGPNLPLAAVALTRKAALTPARRATSLPQSGEWLVAVWRTGTAPAFAAGNFRQTASTECGSTPVDEVVSSLVFVEPMVGGGVFNIDGHLVGMILPCDGRLIAIATASIHSVLVGADAIDQRVLRDYGLGLGPLSAEEKNYFKATDGLLVRDIWTGGAGDGAGLRTGDVVTAVNGLEVLEANDLRAMTTPSDGPLELTILRGSKRMTIALSATGVETVPGTGSPGAGLIMESSPKSYRIASVRPAGSAARAGVQSGDRLIRIDHAEPRSLDQVNRLVGGDQRPPMWLEVERGARRFGVLVR